MSDLQAEIIQRMKTKPEINVQEEIRLSIDFMKDYLKAHPFFDSLVLGISGGQDSTLLGKLAQMAISELRQEENLDKLKFISVRLPYGSQKDESEATDAIEWIKPDKVFHINIKPQVDALVESLSNQGVSVTDFNKGNIKARERMIVQYALAGEFSGAVLGSDHAAENVTGFFTKHGDGASDLNPLFRLNKRQGTAMLKHLGCPEHLYTKVPTADLEDNKPGLSDEDQLGVSYQHIDDYLEGKAVPDEARQTIEKWFKKTEHKRHLPVTPFDDFWKK